MSTNSLDNSKTQIAPFRASGGRVTQNLTPWTEGERRLMDMLVNGSKLLDAARACGFGTARANTFFARPDVKEALHQQRRAYILGNLVPATLKFTLEIIEDDEAPISTRAALSRAVLKMASDMEESDAKADDPGAGDMTLRELADIAARLRSDITAIDAEYTETPQTDSIDDLF